MSWGNWAKLRKDFTAGALASIVNLPICLASGVLAFAPLGPSYSAMGAAAGLCGAIVAGAVSSLISTSSFITTTPRVSTSLVLASLILSLSSNFGHDATLLATAVFLCVALAGLWQSALALGGIAKVIKFTPHPVLVGFLNGIAMLIAISQLKPYFQKSYDSSNLTLLEKPAMFGLLLFVATITVTWPMLMRTVQRRVPIVLNVPSIPAAFFSGIAIFYVINVLTLIDLGPRVGTVSLGAFLGHASLFVEWRQFARVGWECLWTSLIVAIVATVDTLFVFRAMQNVSDLRVAPVRDLFAQGVGNLASAIAGGITSSASPTGTLVAYRAGGRTFMAPVSSALVLLALGLLFPNVLAAIPTVVLSGVLLGVAVLMFDRWTMQALSDVRRAATSVDRRHAFYDLSVVLIVMSLTVLYSVVAGVIAGSVLAALVFVMNMSRPVVRRAIDGQDIQSKRLRPSRDMAILRDTGTQRAVLQLEGVLFFGNADDLSAKVKSLFQCADMVAIDMRGITDMDVSGANILGNLVGKSRELEKDLLFCNIPAALASRIKGLVLKSGGSPDPVGHDLDSALEWMEEKSLKRRGELRGQADVLPLSDIDFVADIDGADLDLLRDVLIVREFMPGETICREGDDGDRMWLLAKGSVSVRITPSGGQVSLRIASLAPGTTIGEMSLIDSAKRSASIVADEHVVCYEFRSADFDSMLASHPDIAIKLLSNLARQLSRRLRRTSEDLSNRN
jgi:sulfate permease, SulP family